MRWGFLSTADIATKVYQAVQVSSNAQVYAVASRSLDSAKKWIEKHPNVIKAYGTYDELLEDEKVQVVYIPLPTAFKKEWAIKAAKKGKHVLLEKPLPVDLKDLQQIIDACKASNVNFMDGTMWLHSIRSKEIPKRLPDLGKIAKISAAFTFAAPNEEWLHGGNGRTDKTREPQGCLECGWYPIGAILFMMNWELPIKVQTHHFVVNKVDTLIYCGGSMFFKNGVWATFDTGYIAAHRCYVEVAGSKGTLLVEDVTGGQGKSGNFAAYFENFVGSSYFKMDDVQGKEEIVTVEPCNHTQLMIEDMSGYVLTKKRDDSWGDISLKMQTVVNAVFDSYLKGGEAIHL